MAFLDFIKNRDGQRPTAEQQSQQQKPENAKEMYTRKDAQDRAAMKSLESVPEQSKADIAEIRARLEKGSQHLNQGAASPTAAPADSTASPEPSRQKIAGQDKAAPELSPTSLQAGKTSQEKDAGSPSVEQTSIEKTSPSPTPSASPTPSPRGRGGWER